MFGRSMKPRINPRNILSVSISSNVRKITRDINIKKKKNSEFQVAWRGMTKRLWL